jgi:hypothetical protein
VRLPVSGQPLHTRSLTIELTQREDGKLRAWGEVIDLRKASFVPMPGGLETAGIIHHMTLDAAVDPATRVLESLDTAQPVVAVEASKTTVGESCRDPASHLQALVGRRFDAEFSAELGRVFGGPRGCSHLLTLFHLLASALPGALDFEEAQARETGAERRAGETLFRRSVFVDGHEPEEGALELAVSLMDYDSAPAALASEPFDLLGRHREVRVLATVTLADVRVVELRAIERVRTRDTLGSAAWQDREAWLEGLAGRPIMPGLGKELRRRLGARPEAAGLLDALLQLAPGFVQCTPALSDRMLERLARRRSRGAERPRLPGFLGMGGAADSCYMWRRDGPLLKFHSPAKRSGG